MVLYHGKNRIRTRRRPYRFLPARAVALVEERCECLTQAGERLEVRASLCTTGAPEGRIGQMNR